MNTENSTADEVVHAVTAVALTAVLDDDMWRSFGFSGGRPKRGALFSKLLSLLPGNRIERENVLLRELTCYLYASLSCKMSQQYDLDANRLAARALELLLYRDGIAQAYSFESDREMLDFFLEGLEDYLAVPNRKAHIAFSKRVDRQLKGILPGRWVGVMTRLSAMDGPSLSGVKMTEGLGETVTGNVQLNNEWMADAVDPHQGPKNEFLR